MLGKGPRIAFALCTACMPKHPTITSVGKDSARAETDEEKVAKGVAHEPSFEKHGYLTSANTGVVVAAIVLPRQPTGARLPREEPMSPPSRNMAT